MTNLFYPLRRTLFVVALIATISMVAVAGLAVRNAVHTPRRYAVFTVQSGERLSSLWSRLETNGVASRAALTRLAATAPFSAYPFVPPREGDPRRFEGLFVPGHYRIALPAQRGVRREQQLYDNDRVIVGHLLAAFARRLQSVVPAGERVTYDDIILASIVQKEDVPGRNYGLVASVFQNRLLGGMHLSSCPTLEFALGYHRPFLLDSDVAVKTPYNTYLNPGLPPTPICFFSRAALGAVVHPVSSPYYFFVLNWVTDRITFARTYAQQKKNAGVARADYIRVHGVASLHRKEPGVFY